MCLAQSLQVYLKLRFCHEAFVYVFGAKPIYSAGLSVTMETQHINDSKSLKYKLLLSKMDHFNSEDIYYPIQIIWIHSIIDICAF